MKDQQLKIKQESTEVSLNCHLQDSTQQDEELQPQTSRIDQSEPASFANSAETSRKSPDDEPAQSDYPDLGDRYEVLEKIGAGGMGSIWKVHDRSLDKILAIKILLPEMLKDAAAVMRFEQEAKLAADLTHVNIASVYGPGKDKCGNQFIIMNYIDGESLADVLAREGKLSEERAMDIFQQICAALSHSHMKGVIHRDVKPSNIIISKTAAGADLVHVVDFGIAKSVYGDVHGTQALTRTADAMGSPLYISPEQCLGEEVTERSDIYSVGCVLYEMLTGAPPFTEKNPVKLLVQHLTEEPNVAIIPENLRALVSIALCKQKDARPKTISDLLDYEADDSQYRPFAHDPRAFRAIAYLPPTAFLLLSAFLLDLQDNSRNFIPIALMLWLMLVTFFLGIASANFNNKIPSSPIRNLEKCVFVACLVWPIMFLVQLASPTWFCPFGAFVFVALFVTAAMWLQNTRLYDRGFVWTHKEHWSFRLLNLCILTFGFASTICGWCGAFLVAAQLQIWRITGDLNFQNVPAAVAVPPLIAGLFVATTGVRRHTRDLKDIIATGLKEFSVALGIGLVATTCLCWAIVDPSLTSLLKQTTGSHNFVKLATDTLAAPNSEIGDLARLAAVDNIHRRMPHVGQMYDDALALAAQLDSQIISNDKNPLIRSIALGQMCGITSGKDGWNKASAIFDQSLEELKQVSMVPHEQNLQWWIATTYRWTPCWHLNRADTALDLTNLAVNREDFTRAQKAIDFIEKAKLDLSSSQQEELRRLKNLCSGNSPGLVH